MLCLCCVVVCCVVFVVLCLVVLCCVVFVLCCVVLCCVVLCCLVLCCVVLCCVVLCVCVRQVARDLIQDLLPLQRGLPATQRQGHLAVTLLVIVLCSARWPRWFNRWFHKDHRKVEATEHAAPSLLCKTLVLGRPTVINIPLRFHLVLGVLVALGVLGSALCPNPKVQGVQDVRAMMLVSLARQAHQGTFPDKRGPNAIKDCSLYGEVRGDRDSGQAALGRAALHPRSPQDGRVPSYGHRTRWRSPFLASSTGRDKNTRACGVRSHDKPRSTSRATA